MKKRTVLTAGFLLGYCWHQSKPLRQALKRGFVRAANERLYKKPDPPQPTRSVFQYHTPQRRSTRVPNN